MKSRRKPTRKPQRKDGGGWTLYTGTLTQIMIRNSGYDAAKEKEVLQKGEGVFWDMRQTADGSVYLRIYSERKVARKLGIPYTGQQFDVPFSVLEDDEKFTAWLQSQKIS